VLVEVVGHESEDKGRFAYCGFTWKRCGEEKGYEACDGQRVVVTGTAMTPVVIAKKRFGNDRCTLDS
jgi:hypothetical protein